MKELSILLMGMSLIFMFVIAVVLVLYILAYWMIFRKAGEYKEALNLEPVREKNASDGSFKLVYLGDGVTDFTLELTWLRDRKEAYDLGECEFHLAFHVDDFDGTHKHHEEMGCICYENPGMGIYFIKDPDGYWLEIVPADK